MTDLLTRMRSAASLGAAIKALDEGADEIERLRALLRDCPYEVNRPQSLADAQWVRAVRAALGERHE